MKTSGPAHLAHQLAHEGGRGKSGKRLLAAAALVAVVVVFLMIRKKGAGGAATAGGSYYDAAGNLYDASGNLLVPAQQGSGDATGSDGLSALSQQLDQLQQEIDQLGQGAQQGKDSSSRPRTPGVGTGDKTPPPTKNPHPGNPGGKRTPATTRTHAPAGAVDTGRRPDPASATAIEHSGIYQRLTAAGLPGTFVDATDHPINGKGFRVGGADPTLN